MPKQRRKKTVTNGEKVTWGKQVYVTETASFYDSVTYKNSFFAVSMYVKTKLRGRNEDTIGRIISLFSENERGKAEIKPCFIRRERNAIDFEILVEQYRVIEVPITHFLEANVAVVSKRRLPKQVSKGAKLYLVKYSLDREDALLPFHEPEYEYQESERLQFCTKLAKEYLPVAPIFPFIHGKEYPINDVYKFSHVLFKKIIPKNLLGREKEADKILNFVKDSLMQPKASYSYAPMFSSMTEENYPALLNSAKGICDSSKGLYTLVGMPGTGKTLTTVTVLNRLKAAANEDRFCDFKVLFVNCFKHRKSADVYFEIFEKLTGMREIPSRKSSSIAIRHACEQELFSRQRHTKFVLVVDEIDEIFKKRDKEVINMFFWPYIMNRLKGNGSLSIIAISNQFDLLQDKYFPSVLGVKRLRLQFETYSHEELKKIIEEKLKHIKWENLFDTDAIFYCSMAASKILGDYRCVNQIMKCALNLVKIEKIQNSKMELQASSFVVRLSHVQQAVRELQQSPSDLDEIKARCGQAEILILNVLSKICSKSSSDDSIITMHNLSHSLQRELDLLNTLRINHYLNFGHNFQEQLLHHLNQLERLGEIKIENFTNCNDMSMIKGVHVERAPLLEYIFNRMDIHEYFKDFENSYIKSLRNNFDVKAPILSS